MIIEPSSFVCAKGENINGNQRIILAKMANWLQEDRWNQRKRIFYSIKFMANEVLRTKSNRSVQHAIEKLEKFGWLVVVKGTRVGSRNPPNQYLAGPKLKAFFKSIPLMNKDKKEKKANKIKSDYQLSFEEQQVKEAKRNAEWHYKNMLESSLNKSAEFKILAFKLSNMMSVRKEQTVLIKV